MIELFHINNHVIDTSQYSNLLHDGIVQEFEHTICDYVGAKHGVSVNSATSAIFLSLLHKNVTVKIPSIMTPVVLNAIITSGNSCEFIDCVNWVGDSYTLHNFNEYKIVDSAQKIEKNQFKHECNPQDLMIFSFYPTKPVGGIDGGLIVSNDLDKINYLRELSFNGMSFSKNAWERKVKFPGYKMYMNSIQCDIALRNFKLYEEKIKRLAEIRNLYNFELKYQNTSNHLYRINLKHRDKFLNHMKANNVQCGIHYKALHTEGNLPKSDSESVTTVSLPFHEKLQDTEVNYIIDLVKKFINEVN